MPTKCVERREHVNSHYSTCHASYVRTTRVASLSCWKLKAFGQLSRPIGKGQKSPRNEGGGGFPKKRGPT